ncbi:hypothetical protein LZ575_13310 [Antarcticibacterium sp. 1MA-6-2]|uniref:hypothetical protein n=1 Tax=Antarcticibacterium sp. 1MA-6-2 TaxID=2908210 RepID=UPI001F1EFFB4|nr:hypothetical protein [Antarcticibacterium sp. 1MA-6-2]UJH89944.1 hypothetical protein LZ575_13310 [Antarcticibacterium sp. 1MA-6-2]
MSGMGGKKTKSFFKKFPGIYLRTGWTKLETPSLHYRNMMDEMLTRVEEGDIHFSPMEEIQKKYGF